MAALLLIALFLVVESLREYGKRRLIEKDLRQQIVQLQLQLQHSTTPSSPAPSEPHWKLVWRDGAKNHARIIAAPTEVDAIRLAISTGLTPAKFVSIDRVVGSA